MKSFVGKINFIRRFIPNFAEIDKPLSRLLKKYCEFKCGDKRKRSLKKIKEPIMSTLVLVSLDYFKDFIIFSFSSDDTIVGVLFQKNSDNMEKPNAFMSKNLRDAKFKYTSMEKQTYALVQSLKHSRHVWDTPIL
jgi:hypothetical protein